MASNDLGAILGIRAPVDADLDAVIRTVYGEAGREPEVGQKAVAAVIRNRADRGGLAFADVVRAPGQFEVWSDPKARARMERLTPGSEPYEAIRAVVEPVVFGEEPDPTGGATHFYSPRAQKALGRNAPAWDDGSGEDIGNHRFFRLADAGGGMNDDLAQILGIAPETQGTATAPKAPAPKAAIPQAQSKGEPLSPFLQQWVATGEKGAPAPTDVPTITRYKDTGKTVLSPQDATVMKLTKGGLFDEKAEPGSRRNPYVENELGLSGLRPGDYYVAVDGTVGRIPGGEEDNAGNALLQGFGRGVSDVAQSLGQLLPGAGDSEVLARLQADQALYDAEHKGGLIAGAGRLGGQLAGTIPAMAGAEAGLGVMGAKSLLGPLGRFAAGEAGGAAAQGAPMAARIGNRLLQGASLGTRGALEGAGAAALVSSASDVPLEEQLATGAALGGLLRPVAPAVVGGVRKLVGGGKLAGAVENTEQLRRYAQAQGLPVAVPQTAGQITGSPSQQMMENALLRGGSGNLQAERIMQDNAARATGALAENVPTIQGRIAGRALVPGEGASLAQGRLVEMERTAKRGVDEAYNAARAVGNEAMLAKAEGPRNAMIDELGAFDPENTHIQNVVREVERFGEKDSPTVRQLFEARSRLSELRASADTIEAKAAASAVRGLDKYIDDALTNDLFLGDPKAVDAWRKAIQSRAQYGKLFEGDDLIDKLTATTRHGEGVALKIAPEDAANYILGRSRMGTVGKADLTRDLKRLREVLGPDSDGWNGLRGEVFAHIAKAARGSVQPDGETAFSGQKFANAWRNFKADSPQIAKTLFTPEERALIDDLAEVSMRVTVPVPGGSNSSNTAVAGKLFLKKAMDGFWSALGAAGGAAGGMAGGPAGAAAGAGAGAGAGRALAAFLNDVKAIRAASKATSFRPSAKVREQNRLLNPVVGGVVVGNRLLGQPSPDLAVP